MTRSHWTVDKSEGFWLNDVTIGRKYLIKFSYSDYLNGDGCGDGCGDGGSSDSGDDQINF
jgi:hypothetical protein